MPFFDDIMRLLRPARRAATTLPSRLQPPDPQFLADLDAVTGRPRPAPPPSPVASPPPPLPANLQPPAPPAHAAPVQPASLQGVNPATPAAASRPAASGARIEETPVGTFAVYDQSGALVLTTPQRHIAERMLARAQAGTLPPASALRTPPASPPAAAAVPASIAGLTPGAQASLRRAYDMVIADGRLRPTVTFEEFANTYMRNLRNMSGSTGALQRTVQGQTPTRQATTNMATPQPGATPVPPPTPAQSRRAGPVPSPPARTNILYPSEQAFFDQHIGRHGISADEFTEKYLGGWFHPMYSSFSASGAHAQINAELRAKPGMHIFDRSGQLLAPNAYVGSITRYIDFNQHKFENAYFQLSSSVKGTGIAKWILKNQYELYDRMGITKGSVHAALDMGGYVWAKYGFIPTRPDWRSVARRAQTLLAELVRTGQVDQQTRSEVERLLQSDDPMTIWRLADFNVPLLGSNSAPDMTIGKKLLMGQHWHGNINLQNNVQRDRFNRYVRNARSPYAPPSP